MQHIVWPAVRSGHITSAPNEHRDNPEWWCEGIAPILADDRVFKLYWRGGKKRARGSWSHVCRELATHRFERQEATVPFIQKTVEEFLAAAGYQMDAAATTRCGAQVTGQQFAAAALVPGASGSRSSSAGASQHAAAG